MEYLRTIPHLQSRHSTTPSQSAAGLWVNGVCVLVVDAFCAFFYDWDL